MAFIVKIFSKSNNNESLDHVIAKVATNLSEKHTKILADETKKQMDINIEATRVRPSKTTGLKLKDSIQVEKISEGYGVGNFDTLNQKTPWWAWINYGRAFSGREIPPGTDENERIKGQFVPDQKGLFQKGFYPINPKKAITAHNYIEKTLAFMYGVIKNGGLLK